MTDTRIRYVHAEDGARLAYRDEGEGAAVLALAGLTRDGRDFDYLAGHLRGVRLIRLDARGRGASDWTGPDSYTVAQEARDAIALMDHLGLSSVAVIGSSRGGLIGMVLAATAPARLTGLCLNDVGPVLDPAGLGRILDYLGLPPGPSTLAQMAQRLAGASSGFSNVPATRWLQEATRHFTETPSGLGLTYDPALRVSFQAAMAGPEVDLWPLFDAACQRPLALVRGANSDLLSAQTTADMCRRAPGMIWADVPDRGHIPFLDEPEALHVIGAWLGQMGMQAEVDAGSGQLS